MSEQRAYVRVYWSIIDDPKFVEVYDDDRHLACWLRLLISADQAWPASAPIPANARKASLAKLVEVKLVDLMPGHRYRIHGLDAERNARVDAARSAAAMRWHSGRNADPMPSRTEPSLTKPSRDDAPDPEWLKAWWATGRSYLPTPKQQVLIDSYLRTFDVTGDERLAAVFLRSSSDPIAGLKADLAAFRQERVAEAQAAEMPKPAPRRRAPGLTGVNAELAALLRAKDAEGGTAA